MSSVRYETKALDDSNVESLNLFLKDFYDNCILSGLQLDYNYKNDKVDSFGTQTKRYYSFDTFPDEFNNLDLKIGTTVYQKEYVCSMSFSLPLGTGINEYESLIERPDIKKIVSSSYDSTNALIDFDFYYYTYTSNGIDKFTKKKIMCDVNIYDINNNFIASCGIGNLYRDDSNLLNSPVYNMIGQSYISNTRNLLSMSIGCHTVSGYNHSGSNNNYKRYMINFSLYRKNGSIYVVGIPHTRVDSTTTRNMFSSDNSDTHLWSINEFGEKSGPLLQRNFGMSYFPYNELLINSETYIHCSKFYAENNNNKYVYIPEIKITKLMSIDAVTYEVIYNIDGNKVLGSFVNLGMTDRSHCPQVRSTNNFSYSYMFDETIIYN